MLKKILLCLVLTVSAVTLSNASSKYYIDDAAIDNIFANSQEMQIDASSIINFYNPLNTTSFVGDKSKVTAGILAILIGACGVHRFYLGHSKAGGLYILLGICTGLSGVLGLIDGVMYLMATDEEFQTKFVQNDKFLHCFSK